MAAVGRDLKVARKLLYEWRGGLAQAWRDGLESQARAKAGLSRRASPDAEPAAPAPLTELARAQARIVELERKIGKQQMDIDFFREALRLIDALEPKAPARTSSTRSSKP